MENHWIERGSSSRLVIFALGWAADWRIVRHLEFRGFDMVCIYDYRNLSGADELLHAIKKGNYEKIYLFAWSFGVWVAEQIFTDLPLTRAVALNGTPHPIDPKYGIEPRRMAVTIRGLREGGMDAFNRRAYGGSYQRLQGVLSPRPLEQNIEELEQLVELSQEPYSPSIEWSEAIVGEQDLIFTPDNMINYWGVRTVLMPLPHYPFESGSIIKPYLE